MVIYNDTVMSSHAVAVSVTVQPPEPYGSMGWQSEHCRKYLNFLHKSWNTYYVS